MSAFKASNRKTLNLLHRIWGGQEIPAMANPATLRTTLLLQFPNPNLISNQIPIFFSKNHTPLSIKTNPVHQNTPLIFAYSSNSTTMSTALSWSETDQESEEEFKDSSEDDDDEEEEEVEEDGSGSSLANMGHASPVRRSRRRRRYRKQYPGEKKGITEEMRFVAMKLRNSGKPKKAKDKSNGSRDDAEDKKSSVSDDDGVEDERNGESWEPSMEGFLKYLVDSKLVFSTVERIVDESSDVSYAYFRKTGLERAECLSKDLEWFREQGNSIPEPSNPGVTYAQYLEELAEKSPPLFMSHLYNIYFSHVAGGQVIAKKVSEKLLQGRELEVFKWEGNEEELLRGARKKLNMLGEHWSRDEKNKCLREATKAFRFLGQIVRLIIL